jgi:hypothetical protein
VPVSPRVPRRSSCGFRAGQPAGSAPVSHARQRGSFYLPEEGALLWERVSRMVAEADRQALTSIGFWLPR